MPSKLYVIDDADTMAQSVAHHIADIASQTLKQEKRRATIMLAGGSTPKAVYTILRDRYTDVVANALEIFFGDVRMVEDDHKDSNFAMVRDSLLLLNHPSSGGDQHEKANGTIKVEDDLLQHVHLIQTTVPADVSAEAYEANILDYFNCADNQLRHNCDISKQSGEEGGARANSSSCVPSFDIVMLGFGPDGHTASLFPQTNAPLERGRLVTSCMPTPSVSPLVERVTITRSLITAARNIICLARGAEKQWVLTAIVSEEAADYCNTNKSNVYSSTVPVAADILKEAVDSMIHLYVDSAAAPP